MSDSYFDSWALCKKWNIPFDKHSLNAVRFSPTETYQHKRMKFEFANAVLSKGGSYMTELSFKKDGKTYAEADFVWLNEGKVFEFENMYTHERISMKHTQFSPLHVIVFDLGLVGKYSFDAVKEEFLYKAGLS